jgi:drug/metabolite transporter (DMT)-like permease
MDVGVEGDEVDGRAGETVSAHLERVPVADITAEPKFAVSRQDGDQPLLGIGFNLLGITVFSAQDVIIKLLSGDYPIFQIMLLRSLLAAAIIAAVVIKQFGIRGLRPRRAGPILLRAVIFFVTYIAFYLSVAALPLADAFAIAFSAPLMVTALSKPLLGEQVCRQRWLAILAGFVGVLIMVRPGLGVFQLASFLALLAAFMFALGSIVTRRIDRAESSWTMSFYAMLVFVAGSAVGSLLFAVLELSGQTDASLAFLTRPWSGPPGLDLGLIAVTGVVATVGHVCLAKAYRLAPVSTVAPFEYAHLVLAAICGYLIWGDIPSVTTWIGAVIIVGSGLYIASRARD